MLEQIIDTIASDPLQHVSQIDLVPLLRMEVGDGIDGGQPQTPLIPVLPNEEIAASLRFGPRLRPNLFTARHRG